MSIGYAVRRLLLTWRMERVRERAAYCRAVRVQAEASIAHHDAEARRLRAELATLERRTWLARLGGGA